MPLTLSSLDVKLPHAPLDVREVTPRHVAEAGVNAGRERPIPIQLLVELLAMLESLGAALLLQHTMLIMRHREIVLRGEESQ